MSSHCACNAAAAWYEAAPTVYVPDGPEEDSKPKGHQDPWEQSACMVRTQQESPPGPCAGNAPVASNSAPNLVWVGYVTCVVVAVWATAYGQVQSPQVACRPSVQHAWLIPRDGYTVSCQK